ncbi:MAG: phosphoglycerate kinase, partial [Pseudomonadota bacterium]
MASFKTISDFSVSGQRVLVRVDFNVPVQNGSVSDATRLERALPTVKSLREAGAKIILLSHFGRPKGQVVPDMSLAPVAEACSSVLGAPVAFAADSIGDTA